MPALRKHLSARHGHRTAPRGTAAARLHGGRATGFPRASHRVRSGRVIPRTAGVPWGGLRARHSFTPAVPPVVAWACHARTVGRVAGFLVGVAAMVIRAGCRPSGRVGHGGAGVPATSGWPGDLRCECGTRLGAGVSPAHRACHWARRGRGRGLGDGRGPTGAVRVGRPRPRSVAVSVGRRRATRTGRVAVTGAGYQRKGRMRMAWRSRALRGGAGPGRAARVPRSGRAGTGPVASCVRRRSPAARRSPLPGSALAHHPRSVPPTFPLMGGLMPADG